VALVNGGTAREAELVAGALQDNRRGVLLGTQTFGETSIESVIPLPGNGAIRLTTSRFMTPTGRQIQGKGLTPDLLVMPLKLEKLAHGDRRRESDLRGALKNTDPIGPNNTPPAQIPANAPATPPEPEAPSVATGDIGSPSDEQLSQAMDVLRGLALVTSRPAP
jgi:carboxyl-terminal processing protease